MIRRKFLGLLTLTGAGGIAALSARASSNKTTARFKVEGFTCITCATGLETLLERERGVLGVIASYPQATAIVSYDAKQISQADLIKAIESMGFTPRLANEPAC